jgi:phosphate transport system permease protein
MIGLMALPTVVSVAEDALSTVPDSMKDGSLAMGSTKWQTTKSVTLPTARSGVSAGVVLFVIVMLLSTSAQYVEWRMRKKLQGER